MPLTVVYGIPYAGIRPPKDRGPSHRFCPKRGLISAYSMVISVSVYGKLSRDREASVILLLGHSKFIETMVPAWDDTADLLDCGK